MSNYASIDLYWGDIGDCVLDESGDLKDTSRQPLRSLYQEIRTRMEAGKGDWKQYPNMGYTPRRYVGKPNTKQLGLEMERSARTELTADNLVHSGDLYLRVVPVSESSVLMRLKVDCTNTPSVVGSESVVVSYAVDIIRHGPLYAG